MGRHKPSSKNTWNASWQEERQGIRSHIYWLLQNVYSILPITYTQNNFICMYLLCPIWGGSIHIRWLHTFVPNLHDPVERGLCRITVYYLKLYRLSRSLLHITGAVATMPAKLFSSIGQQFSYLLEFLTSISVASPISTLISYFPTKKLICQ